MILERGFFLEVTCYSGKDFNDFEAKTLENACFLGKVFQVQPVNFKILGKILQFLSQILPAFSQSSSIFGQMYYKFRPG